MNFVEVKIFQVKCGDCISVSYDDGVRKCNLIIDSGYTGTYHQTLKQEIASLGNIDLFVITHTDDDHIGGMKSFISEYPNPPVHEFLYNFSSIDIKVSPKVINQKSIKQGISLRNYLSNIGKINTERPIVLGTEINVGNDIVMKIISPSSQSLTYFEEQCKIWANKKPTSTDYHIDIDKFQFRDSSKDTSGSNGSSIAFILEIKSFKILLLADAHPSVLVEGLKYFGYSKINKLTVDYVKLSHHGSVANISQELIDILECKNYIVSTDGSQHGLPNKEALAQIVRSFDYGINIIFNYKNRILESIFSPKEIEDYDIKIHYPDTQTPYYVFKHIIL